MLCNTFALHLLHLLFGTWTADFWLYYWSYEDVRPQLYICAMELLPFWGLQRFYLSQIEYVLQQTYIFLEILHCVANCLCFF
jgi:hypothetical protein